MSMEKVFRGIAVRLSQKYTEYDLETIELIIRSNSRHFEVLDYFFIRR